MYKILKTVNNNIVCSVDENGQEIILRGLGIGFNKKVGDAIDKSQIEKIYRISNSKTRNKLEELLEDIPLEYVQTSTEIIEYAKKTLKKGINENIYLTLTDHISFAIERLKNNLTYKNALLMEIRRFYPTEYTIGLQALEIIKDNLGITLPIDEAGFIALHVVNAELDTDMSDMMSITELIHKILDIIKSYYKIELNEESLYYDRLITHLKFFGQRLFNNKAIHDEDVVFQEMVKTRYPEDYECANIIRKYIEDTYHKKVGEEEMVFLTVHLKRISMSS